MKEVLVFAFGALAGAFALLMLVSGFRPWPAERPKSMRRHSRDASWLR